MYLLFKIVISITMLVFGVVIVINMVMKSTTTTYENKLESYNNKKQQNTKDNTNHQVIQSDFSLPLFGGHQQPLSKVTFSLTIPRSGHGLPRWQVGSLVLP